MTVTQTARPSRTRTSRAGGTRTAVAKKDSGHRLHLNLPFMSIEVRPPELRMPHVEMPHISRREVGQAVDIARTFLPPPERIAYYGGLGALAVLGLIEWPVAAAIGAGTIIAQRTRTQDRWSPVRPQRAGQAPTTTRTAERTGDGARSTSRSTSRTTTGRSTTRRASTGRSTTGRSTTGRSTTGRTSTRRTSASRTSAARTSAAGTSAAGATARMPKAVDKTAKTIEEGRREDR